MVGVTTFYLLLLICLQSFILGTNAAVPTKSENLHNHDFKSQTDSQLTDKTESDTATQKSCRFRWKWESIVYGDICLPAKSSLIKRQKTSSIRRHRHRHKNRDYTTSLLHSRDTWTCTGRGKRVSQPCCQQVILESIKWMLLVMRWKR